MPYPEEMVAPMRHELASLGIDELKTADAVDNFIGENAPSAMIVINSVCGCAAGSARPAVAMAMQHENKPVRIGTVFAGNDVDAVAKVRSLTPDVPPSSPSVLLLKDGKPAGFIPRHVFESTDPNGVSEVLKDAFAQLFGGQEG